MTCTKPAFSSGKLLTRVWPFIAIATLGCSSIPEFTIRDDDGGKPDGTGGQSSGSGGSFNVGDAGSSNTGGKAEEPAVCGNGKLEVGEVCDDGGKADDDGCSGDCLTQDLNFVCTPGEACVNTVVCGSGVLEGDEACDDGNDDGGDGCSANCSEVEAGFACPRPGKDCIALPACGNGVRERGEGCDDGEAIPTDGDGCSTSCQLESGFFCPIAGQKCVEIICGDGVRTPGKEECDDGQATPTDGDGCSITCTLEPGFHCSGTTCQSVCGDGILRGSEECDDQDRQSGDGCSAACTIEPNYTCGGTPSVCTSTIVCGDNVVGFGELCDPPGVAGCLAGCKSFSPDAGQAAVCGNQILEYGETCEGASLPYEGCLSGCKADTGYTCPRSDECFKVPACGDGIVQAGEGCDVGSSSNSGCLGCVVQSGWFCYGPGPSVCEQSICGDGVRGLDEECDDGNPTSSDGCTSCQVDTGYVCPTAGVKCVAKCGDGLVRGIEVCDDGDTDSGDGCSSTCRVEPSFFCVTNPCADGEVPKAQNCGNGTVEGSETCDDGANDLPFDGCYKCKKDPVCSGGNCTSICGDGQRFGDEACDDGNNYNGDGCSSTCAVEDGFSCTDFTGTPPSTLDLPVIARDFVGVNRQYNIGANPTPNNWAAWQTATIFHPDFNAQFGAAMRGMVKSTLSASKKPEWNWVPYATQIAKPPATDLATEMPPTNLTQCSCGTSSGDTPPACTCSDSTVCYCDNPGARRWATTNVRRPILSVPSRFAQWYTNDSSVNLVKAVTVTLTRDVATGTYGFDSANTTQNAGKNFMDPFGSAAGGQVAANKETMANGTSCGGSAADRNASWTTETHFWFEYAGGEKFDFAGDDDTWVFVDGKLVVDLGGLHGAMAGSFTLDKDTDGGGADTADGSAVFTTGMSASGTTTQYPANGTVSLGLAVGGVYEVVMFQAERNECGSNFKVTLKDFNKPKSVCTPTCGDGKVVGSEVCDDGTGNNVDNTYGKCNTTCSARLYCGDGTKTVPNEVCDNGLNVDTYDVGQANACAPGCTTPGKCGDSVVQAAFEVCDKGGSNSNSSYGAGSCNATCGLGGYCGDGSVQATYESCDNGTGNTGYQAAPGGCGYDCQEAAHCGDGVRNGPEECDLGADNGGVGKSCDATCHLLPYCGDGLIQTGESCDYGQFASNAYGSCKADCNWGPNCGDGTKNGPEECDLGDGNGPGYGDAVCSTDCTRGARCGDGVLQSSEGEICDNGFNEDTYEYDETSCADGCVRPPYCGDGNVASGIELCDAGAANSDTAYEGCKLDCTWGPYCGDGTKNVGSPEKCDDGAANTGYSATKGGCGYDCEWAPYCGDGVRNGPEACDLGKDNKDGVYGGCNENCTLAPRCGDYIKQPGESCDEGPVGSVSCTPTCKNRVITK